MTETPDQRAERLLGIGLDIAARIRDEHPADVARALGHLDQAQLRDLALLLAACVDVDQPRRRLLAWWNDPALFHPADKLQAERYKTTPPVPKPKPDTDEDRARRRAELAAVAAAGYGQRGRLPKTECAA